MRHNWVFFTLLLLAITPALTHAAENVAVGKPYTVEMGWDNEQSRNDERNYPDIRNRQLTDGEFAQQAFWHHGWVGFAQGFERRVTIDLQDVHSISEVRARFLQRSDAGIQLPRWVVFEVSADGTNWEKVGQSYFPGRDVAEEQHIWTFQASDLAVAGRYVRVTFPVAQWVFSDEIQVIGTKGIEPSVRLAAGEPDPPRRPEGYRPPGTPDVAGVRHILVAPVGGWNAVPGFQYWNHDDFLPFVAYIDGEGTPQDWLFDTILLSPPKYSEARREYGERNNQGNAGNLADWQLFLQTLFRPDQQLDALNQAAATAKEALGDPDYKVKVIIATLYPPPVQSFFGDVDGDGVIENFDYRRGEAAVNDAKKAIDWYLAELLAAWDEAAFEHLDLVGIYWQMEDVGWDTVAFEEAVIKYTADKVHEAGLKFFWIPYMRAGLYQYWDQLGFDAAIMQPNHMFSSLNNLLEDNAQLTYAAHMGVEMEADAFKDRARDQKWIEYLNAGVEYGFMNDAVVGWYQHIKDFARAARMEGYYRELYYDYVYEFIKGTYTVRSLD